METIRNIADICEIPDDKLYVYSEYKAKVKYEKEFKNSKVILVTATNPTKYGEGKTTVAIGLNDALRRKNIKSILTLREPSMGPVFGVKGGATGGGKATIVPEVDINLHFTGDFHAITSANNLICAVVDNEIYQGNSLGIDRVVFNRCLDMNDRALRDVTIHNGKNNTREEHFNITAASELMAIFCLAKDMDDMKRRIGKIIVGYTKDDREIYVADLGIVDAVMSLLMDAINPNLVQSCEGNPVLVHGGPFANIAHGCNSLIALNTASHYGDYIITEAGFGADAGAFKFMDIVSRNSGIIPDVIVLVTTVRALKYNGNSSLEEGILNLQAHIDNLKTMSSNVVVTINRFSDDTDEELAYILNYVSKQNIPTCINDVYSKGSEGALELADLVLANTYSQSLEQLYDVNDSLEDKIFKYVTNISHAKDYVASEKVLEKIKKLDKYKYPICVAKTQYSISHDAKLLGYPKDYLVEIKDVEVANGAEFIKVFLGNIISMPGLSKNPAAKEIKIVDDEIILPR